MKIAYIVPSYLVCGGHRIVFEHCNRLAERGHEVFIISTDLTFPRDWFDFHKGIRHIVASSCPKDLDILVGTYWKTLYSIQELGLQAKQFFYFVQSDERRFFGEPLQQKMVEDTYHSDSHFITIARWLQDMLENEFCKSSVLVENGLNFEHFYPEPVLMKKRLTVLVEGSVETMKKGVFDAMKAIEGLDVDKWLVTTSSKITKLFHCSTQYLLSFSTSYTCNTGTDELILNSGID